MPSSTPRFSCRDFFNSAAGNYSFIDLCQAIERKSYTPALPWTVSQIGSAVPRLLGEGYFLGAEQAFSFMLIKTSTLPGAQMRRTIDQNVFAAKERMTAGIELVAANAALNKYATGFYMNQRRPMNREIQDTPADLPTLHPTLHHP